MEAPHLPRQLGTGRGIRPSQISMICGMDHEFSEHKNVIKPVQPGPVGFCQALVVLGWTSPAETHPSRDFSQASDKPTAPLGLVLVRRRWLLTIISREMVLPRCLARQKRPCLQNFLGIIMVLGSAEGQYPLNEDLVLHTNRTPPPAWPPLFLLPGREMGKLASLRITTEQ